MSHTVVTRGEVRADHSLTIQMPDIVPAGPVRVTVVVESEGPSGQMTAVNLAKSEFVGMWADREDLPKTDEEFLAWRRSPWARSPERYSSTRMY